MVAQRSSISVSFEMRVPFNSFGCNARMCATGSSLVPVTLEVGMLVLAEVVVAAACVVIIVVLLVAPLGFVFLFLVGFPVASSVLVVFVMVVKVELNRKKNPI